MEIPYWKGRYSWEYSEVDPSKYPAWATKEFSDEFQLVRPRRASTARCGIGYDFYEDPRSDRSWKRSKNKRKQWCKGGEVFFDKRRYDEPLCEDDLEEELDVY